MRFFDESEYFQLSAFFVKDTTHYYERKCGPVVNFFSGVSCVICKQWAVPINNVFKVLPLDGGSVGNLEVNTGASY
jgi:hypothetical protein